LVGYAGLKPDLVGVFLDAIPSHSKRPIWNGKIGAPIKKADLAIEALDVVKDNRPNFMVSLFQKGAKEVVSRAFHGLPFDEGLLT